jgi:hypothetical protein
MLVTFKRDWDGGSPIFSGLPSDGFRFKLITDGNPSHEFPVLDGNPSSNMNSATVRINIIPCSDSIYCDSI